MRVDDINVGKWMELLATIQRTGGGCFGTLAVASMVRALVQNTRATVDGLPQIVAVQRAVNPVRDELALLEARSESYMTRLQAVAEPSTADDRIDCERIAFWLTTGVTPDEPPMQPVLAMGDARLAATLWNQVAPIAANEASIVDGHPFPDAFTTMRELLSQAESELSTASPGEPKSVRDEVVGTVHDAYENASTFIKAAIDDAWLTAKLFAAGAGVLVLLFLLWKYKNRS